jgi:hypothetical protein
MGVESNKYSVGIVSESDGYCVTEGGECGTRSAAEPMLESSGYGVRE